MKSTAQRSHAGTASRSWAPLALVAMAFAVYAPMLPGEFFWDDRLVLLKNNLLLSPGGLIKIWTTTGLIPTETHWWPLTYTVFWIEHALFGFRAVGFHLVNIALHAAVSIQLWRLMRRMALPGAFFGAALFCLHPVHVEAVAWISDLKDLLAALLGLFAIEAMLAFEERPSSELHILAALATGAAMLAKSSAIAIPAGMTLLIWHQRGQFARTDIKALAPSALVAFAMALFDWRVNAALTPFIADTPPLIARMDGAGRAVWFYAEKLVWPFRLSVVYPNFDLDPSRLLDWAPHLAAIAATALLWRMRGRLGRGPLACWLFYLTALGPILGVFHFNFLVFSPVADHYQYLASLAPLAGFGALLGIAFRKLEANGRRALTAAAALVLVGLGVQAARCVYVFRSSIAIFSNAAVVKPNSFRVCTLLANSCFNAGQLDGALAALETGLRIDSDKTERLGDLGLVLMKLGRDGEAIVHFRRGLALTPDDANLQFRLATVLVTSADPAIRNPAEALSLIQPAIERSPPNGDYLDTLAAALAASGDFSGAIAAETRAQQLAAASGLKDRAAEFGEHLRLFQARRPFVRNRENR